MVGAAMLAATSPALAAEALKFGPPAPWVVPQPIPPAFDKAKDTPVAILLHDQQTFLEAGKVTTYSALAFKIQKPEGLAAGNLSIAWNPATDTVTVNRLEIRRGDQLIDVLKSGQTFTTMRRESNLELAMLNGVLTANIQPEGLQEGDVVVFATTTEEVDPVLKGHVEAIFAPWASSQIALAHARLLWPAQLALKIHQSGQLPAAQQSSRGGTNSYELTLRNVEPAIAPKGAPIRFQIGRMGEATDFRSWADAAKLMIPLYREAAVIPGSGPLRDEVEKIRKASGDPAVRAEQALQLVQQRIRYVALLMGQGGLVPAPAETTWSRRFGDCKAKTALLLGILHELGVEAEPIIVNPSLGDAIADRLPSIGLFNHVLVRAHIKNQTYFLDGTRTGDVLLSRVQVPDFGWGLPLVENAALVHLVPAPLTVAESERRIDIDASSGIYAPAKVAIEEIYRGDGAVAFNHGYSQLSADQRTEFLRNLTKRYFDRMTIESSAAQFDPVSGEMRVSTKGTAKLDWDDNWFAVPAASLAYNPDFDRPAGPQSDAPIAVDYPSFETRKVTIKLPTGFPGLQSKLPAPVHETLAGIEYDRSVSRTGDVLTVDSSERSIAQEVPYKTATAAAARLKALNNDDVYLRVPPTYSATAQDLAAKSTEQPASAQEYIDRGLLLLNAAKYDGAIADFSEALKLEPKNIWALADRAIARVWKRNFDQAAADLTAVEALDPTNPVLFRAKGLRAELQRDPKSAIEFYTRSLDRDPGNGFALMHRASSLQAQGKITEALRDLDALVSANPRNDSALAARAMIFGTLRRFDAADKDIDSALAINPKSFAAYEARGDVAMLKGDAANAVVAYSRELELSPGNESALSNRASAYRALGQNELALADADAGLKARPGWPEMRVLRANLFMRQGRREDVEKEAELLEKENPDSEFAFVAAGKTYAALGQNDKALKAFDRAVAIRPLPYVYLNRSQIRPKSDLVGRVADLDAALKLDPDNQDVLAEKARLLTRSGDFTGALAVLDRLKVDPDDRYVGVQRAVVLFKAGRTAEAEQVFKTERATATTPTDFNNLCWTKAINDVLLESALDDCREALKRKPDSGPYEDSLGMALLKLGRLDEALTAYDKAVAKQTGAASLMGRAFVYARKGDVKRAESDAAAARKMYADIDAQFAEYGLKFGTERTGQTRK
jgi:tetratricopeptide (TPR) repeat protein